MRLLQMWLTLPKNQRWVSPRVQDLSLEKVPLAIEEGITIRVYSGTLAGVSSPVSNYVPLIIADIQLKRGVSSIQYLPASFNTFLYVLHGDIKVGDEGKLISQDQVGWLDKFSDPSQSELKLIAGEDGARFILYSAKPQHDPIVSHGPFIGDQQTDILRLYREYREGRMENISEVAESQRIQY